jgi:hypothetical protein
MKDWSEMFPGGRDIFYEGADPEGFAAAMLDHFGFDPSKDPNWGQWIGDSPDDPTGFVSYQFHCAAEYLDDVYGSGSWELGS